jgi:hypothetical protein
VAFGYGVYFTDREHNRVVRWNPDTGQTDIVAGEPADGAPDQLLKDPYALALEPSGQLLITDKLHHRIVRLKNGRLEEVTVRDKDGHRNRRPDSRRAYAPLPLRSPSGLWIEKGGTLLATYYNDHTAYRIHADGRLELLLGISPSRPYFFTERRETVPPTELSDTPLFKPAGILSISDGTMYLVERGFQVVREYHPKRGYTSVFPLGRQGESQGMPRAPEEAPFSAYCPVFPGSLALDGKGMLYLAEIFHRCILEINLSTKKIRRVMESASPAGKGLGGISGLGFGPDGTAWVVDGAAGVVQGYEPSPKKPWKALGAVLREIKSKPLRFPAGGAGVLIGT